MVATGAGPAVPAAATASSTGPAVPAGATPSLSGPSRSAGAATQAPQPTPKAVETSITVTVPYWTKGDVYLGVGSVPTFAKLAAYNEVLYTGTASLVAGSAYYYSSGGGATRELAAARSVRGTTIEDYVLDWDGSTKTISRPGFEKSFYMGACHSCGVSFTKGNFIGPLTTAMEDVRAIGANWVNLVPVWFVVPDYRGNELRAIYAADFKGTSGWVHATIQDSDLVTLIENAHARGLKVYLAPHVAPENWGPGVKGKGDLEPTDPDRFFASYKAFIGHYADIAQRTGVDLFSIGNELDTLTLEDHAVNRGIDKTARWRDVIASVRSRYSAGKLTYSGSCTSEERCGPTLIRFWDALDVIGFEWYVPIAKAAHEPVTSMRANASRIVDRLVRPLSERFGKPVVLTELGWEAYPGSCANTYGVGPSKGGDRMEQASCYEALFQAIEPATFITGMQIWSWTANLPGDTFDWVRTDTANEVRFTIAEKEIAKWYRKIAP